MKTFENFLKDDKINEGVISYKEISFAGEVDVVEELKKAEKVITVIIDNMDELMHHISTGKSEGSVERIKKIINYLEEAQSALR